MASIGSRFDAFFAGYHPKNTPVTVHTTNESTTEYNSITIGQFATNRIRKDAKHPKTTPIKPPVTLIIIDSMRN